MSAPKVSVILPVKDGAPYLQLAVDSILQQSMADLELIIVDDYSTDGALTGLAGTDKRIKVLQSPGRGVVSAFNFGLSFARGEFIARMDADDISLPGRLEAQLALMSSDPSIDIAGTCVEMISEQAIEGGNRHYRDWLNSVCNVEDIHRQLFIESPVPNPTALFRSAAIERLSGYAESDWPEDYDLFLRADRLGMRMAKPDGVLFHWREHDKRLTRTDDRYSRTRFQQAKAHYLVNGRLRGSAVIIWGAGPGGRQFYDLLEQEGCEAMGFIDVHPRRIGGQKRGKPVWGVDQPEAWPDAMILVAVGARGVRPEIRTALEHTGRTEGIDYLFVC